MILSATPTAATDRAPASPDPPRPLVVDADGALVRHGLLWEGLAGLVLRRPARLPAALPALARGRAAFAAYVAREGGPDVATVPLDPAVVRLVDEAVAAGRPVLLRTDAADDRAVALAHRVEAAGPAAGSGLVVVAGRPALAQLSAGGQPFDYVGRAAREPALWAAATHAYARPPAPFARPPASRRHPGLVVLPAAGSPLRAWLRALRPHQWAKNALLVLPGLAAHVTWTLPHIGALLAGLVAFSVVASCVYLVNDLADLPDDRVHATKRRRPLASGDLGIPAAVATLAVLAGVALTIAARLPAAFQLTLACYAVLSAAYCSVLKRRTGADVLTLATLYTLRVVAGAALLGVSLSRWFLAFSVFFFLALALVKRVVELQRRPAGTGTVPGRGYVQHDRLVLTGLGLAATMVSSLVYCLYITSVDVVRIYTHPDVLWIGLLLLLYWQIRVWLLVGRDEMNEDPVVFALRDRMSRLAFAGLLAVVVVAAR